MRRFESIINCIFCFVNEFCLFCLSCFKLLMLALNRRFCFFIFQLFNSLLLLTFIIKLFYFSVEPITMVLFIRILVSSYLIQLIFIIGSFPILISLSFHSIGYFCVFYFILLTHLILFCLLHPLILYVLIKWLFIIGLYSFELHLLNF